MEDKDSIMKQMGARLKKDALSGVRRLTQVLTEAIETPKQHAEEVLALEARITELNSMIDARNSLIAQLKPLAHGSLQHFTEFLIGASPLPAGVIYDRKTGNGAVLYNVIMYVNPSFERAFGWSAQEVKDLNFTSLITEDKDDRELLYRFFRQRPETAQLISVLHKGKKESFWIATKKEFRLGGETYTAFWLEHPADHTPEAQLELKRYIESEREKRAKSAASDAVDRAMFDAERAAAMAKEKTAEYGAKGQAPGK